MIAGIEHKRINRRTHRGQALVIAVLIMFVLVGLSGVFIALVNHALVQTVKSGERDKLEEVTQAGLEYAKKMLLYSPEGADWRPVGDTNLTGDLAGFNKFGDGFYRITIDYGTGAGPLARYLHINIFAYLAEPNRAENDQLPKPFIQRSLDAYMPLGLPDYLRWVTNSDGRTEPATLGSMVMLDGLKTVNKEPNSLLVANIDTNNDFEKIANRTTIPVGTPVLSWFDGPIRSEASLELGNMRLEQVGSGAALEVAGTVRELDTNPGYGGVHVMKNKTTPVDSSAMSADRLTTLRNNNDASVQSSQNNQLVRGLRAPTIDLRDPATGQDRYRTLTRDSVAASGKTVEVLGWGEGIYLNNQNQIQFNHDIDKLRTEWLNPGDTAPWFNGVYNPTQNGQAVEVVLGDWTLDASGNVVALPQIQLRRYDAPFVDVDGNALISQQDADGCFYMYTSYPRNGIIFAEGNLVVKGNLPASIKYAKTAPYAPTGEPGGLVAPNGPIKYYDDIYNYDDIEKRYHDYNRRFDLTIVSGGTIYIDGNLLGPSSRAITTSGSPYDSKLALLAADNVCLNPTHLFDFASASSQPAQAINGENVWRLSQGAGSSLAVSFSTAGTSITRMLLRHAGDSSNLITPYTMMNMAINNVVYQWDATNPIANMRDKMTFSSAATRLTTLSSVLPTTKQWLPNMFPDNPLGRQVLSFPAPGSPFLGFGQTNTVKFEVAGGGDYLLGAGTVDGTLGPGFLITGLDLQVDALCYAQRGSWFIIPGKYPNESADPLMQNQPWPFPKYREPQDVKIIFNGAIVENRPAPLEMENEWTRHWRGANLAYYTTTGSVSDMLDPATNADARRMGIEYHYDTTLAQAICFDIDSQGNKLYRARLPKLPVSPNVYSIGQQSGM